MHFCENSEMVENRQKCLLTTTSTYGKNVFSIILSNSFDLDKSTVKGVFSVAKFKSIVKIELTPFLAALDPIFNRNFEITRKR